VVERERAADPAAVLAGPAIPGEDRTPRDLAAMSISRYSHVGGQPDHDRPRHRQRLRVKVAIVALDDLCARLEHEHGCAPHGTDVDRFERRV
jgi:hypothetical protein